MKSSKTSFLPKIHFNSDENMNPQVLRIILNESFTRIDFGYAANWKYIKGGWIRISPDTHLYVHESDLRFQLIEAQNIPIAPEQHYFESKEDWKVFSLHFEPLPLQDTTFDIIEEENEDPTYFNYYNIKLENVKDVPILEF
jgi:hypothetical protein